MVVLRPAAQEDFKLAAVDSAGVNRRSRHREEPTWSDDGTLAVAAQLDAGGRQ